MPGTGYYDRTTQTYKSLPTETWADYTNWSTFTSWAGTPADSVSFTTKIFDAGKVDWWNTIVEIEATLPADVTIYAGETLESAGQIDIASTTTITPSTSPVAATYGRYFQFTITLNRDSALQSAPEIASINMNFNATPITITQSDINTSTLAGSVGARELTFNQPVGKLTNVMVQAHYTGLDDSAGESQTPVIYIDKTSTPTVLNIFNTDTYGKRTRMDCVVDVQAQAIPRLVSDEFGSIEEA
jgi:hypothetical protein